MAFRPAWQMTDAELIGEADAISRAEDHAALTDPATLMRHLVPTYKRRAHLRVIGAALADLAAGQGDRLLIVLPPQTGKTVTAVVGGAFWWLTRNPNHRVIVGSYGNALAINRGRSVRKLVIEHGHRYGLRLEPGGQAVNDWSLMSGGGLKSVGVGAGVTGSPGDAAFIDDPHKSRAEADSLRKRETVYDWYSADILSRLSPGAPVILALTLWHPDDLAARVLADEGRADDGGRWRVIHMPALCTDPTADPLGRPAGGPLPHPKIPAGDTAAAAAHWADKRRSSTVRDWAALYMGDPQPSEGALLSRTVLRGQRCYPAGAPCGPCATEVQKAAVAVDPSGGGRDTAGIVGGYRAADGRLYLTHDRSGVMPSDQWGREACILAAQTDADRILVENNYGGDMAKLVVRTAWAALAREAAEHGQVWRRPAGTEPGGQSVPGRPGKWMRVDGALFDRLAPHIAEVHARKAKLLRAEPIAQQWTEDRIRTAAYLPELEEEWATWQPDHSDSPGRIDASVYLAYGLLKVPGSGAAGASAAAVSRDQVGAGNPGMPRGVAAPPILRGYPGG